MAILLCDNGTTCPYGQAAVTDEGLELQVPEKAYSQDGSPMYHGLCLNCLDDHRQAMELADWD